jgi:micrococcal nuclease
MRGSPVVLVVALLASLSPTAVAGAPEAARKARVTHVSDGDTAYLKPLRYGSTAASWAGRKARFIGVDTPEVYTSPPDCYGKKASRFTKRKLEGKKVKVTYGRDPLDPYDRALIYVWVRGKLFNLTLVRKGLARVLIYEPNDLYEKRLRRAQRAAKAADRGLWGACTAG